MKKGLFFGNKKAVSPLIATVLLIAFAVALGAIVMSWGRSYIVQTQNTVQQKGDTQMACSSDISIAPLRAAGQITVCYSDSQGVVKYTVKNNGLKSLSGLSVQIIGTNGGVKKQDLKATINVGDIYHNETTYNVSQIGNFSELIITPKFLVGSQEVTCPGSALDLDTTQVHTC